MNGTFARDPKTGKDTFTYKPVSDVFGAKIVSSEHYNPPSSIDIKTKELITKKQVCMKSYASFYTFFSELTAYRMGYETDNPITFRRLYDTYVLLLNRYLKEIDPNSEIKLYNYIDKEKSNITSEINSFGEYFDLDSPIIQHSEFAKQLCDGFEKILNRFESYISTPLTINGFENRIRYTFFDKSTSIKGVSINPSYDIKRAESGRKAIHVDGCTNFRNSQSRFELQFLTFIQFIKDIERTSKCTCINAW